MPIRADLRKYYGPEWLTIHRPRILERARHHCEQCDKPNRATVETCSWISEGIAQSVHCMKWRTPYVLAPGNAWVNRYGSLYRAPRYRRAWAVPMRLITVCLTVAHLNHDPADNRDENLKALCEWCHLIYDLEHHKESRATRKDAARPLLWPTGPADPIGQMARSPEFLAAAVRVFEVRQPNSSNPKPPHE